MSKIFTIPIDGVPDGWEPVAFREVKDGGFFLGEHGNVTLMGILIDRQFGPRLILRKKYTPPAWLKEAGFKAIWGEMRVGRRSWFGSNVVPEWHGMYRIGDGNSACFLSPLNFTPPELGPDVSDKDTLIEL